MRWYFFLYRDAIKTRQARALATKSLNTFQTHKNKEQIPQIRLKVSYNSNKHTSPINQGTNSLMSIIVIATVKRQTA